MADAARSHRRVTAAAVVAIVLALVATGHAQLTRRLAIFRAEDRRAPTVADLATIRAGARSADSETARIGLRALGRLERAALIPDILPGLRHRFPEVRVEAANAVAQAAQGLRSGSGPRSSLGPTQAALIARLGIDVDPTVRAALCEAIGRLPYSDASDVARAESTLVEFATKAVTNDDRLGAAKGLEALARLQQGVRPIGEAGIEALTRLAQRDPGRSDQDLLRDARVRRLALEALIGVDKGDEHTITLAAGDPDTQVRRLAMRAAAIGRLRTVVDRGLADEAPMVRIEALRAARRLPPPSFCGPALTATGDGDTHVVLAAIDLLGTCGHSEPAVTYLAGVAADRADAEAPRNWHRAAHALLALATAAPERARAALDDFAASSVWQLRAAVVRAAAILHEPDVLRALARDPSDNVVEAAIAALRNEVGHAADDLYIAALGRNGENVVRAAAMALERSPDPASAAPALEAAFDRVISSRRAGAIDIRAAVRAALTSIGARTREPKVGPREPAPLSSDDLRRLSSPRARFVIRDVGEFDVALFTTEAPATVLRFAQLVSEGYYNGLTFHRVESNGVVQGGGPDANEYSSNAPLMRDEVGTFPHVRGSLGISTRGRDTGDGQIFIDLVDHPRYDHVYTVFAQVLNGMDTVDRLLPGDVIERVDIVP